MSVDTPEKEGVRPEETTPKRKKKCWLEWGKFAVEVLTIIVVSIYTRVAYHQWEEMRKATKAAIISANAAQSAATTAEESLTSSNITAANTLIEMQHQSASMQGTVREAIRANKIVQEGNDPFVGVSAAFPIVDTQRKTFTIRLEIKNFGKTPATDFEVSPMLFLNFGMIPIPKPQGTVPGTLFPDQPTVTEITVGEPYFGEIMNINNAFFYKVTLRYRSVATRQEFEPCYRGQYAPEIKLNAFKDLGCK